MRTRMSIGEVYGTSSAWPTIPPCGRKSSRYAAPVTRVLALASLLGALLVGVAPAGSVAPRKPGSIVFANGDALGRGTVLELADPSGRGALRVLTPRALSAAMPAVSPDGK